MTVIRTPWLRAAALLGLSSLALLGAEWTRPLGAQAQSAANDFNDSHFHLTNYIQQGIEPRQFLQIMGARVRRSTSSGSLRKSVCMNRARCEGPTVARDR